MTRPELVARARSAIGKGCRYGLGKGGFNPHFDHPWDGNHLCDCSGFIAWVLGMSRHLEHPWYKSMNGGWLETTAIVRDCKSPYGFFAEVPLAQGLPGDLLVYGDRVSEDGSKRQGHVGMITGLDANGPALAVHCSRGNERRTGGTEAILETGVGVFTIAGGIVARYAGVD